MTVFPRQIHCYKTSASHLNCCKMLSRPSRCKMRRCPVQLLHDAEMPHVSIPCPWDIPRPRDLMEYNIHIKLRTLIRIPRILSFCHKGIF